MKDFFCLKHLPDIDKAPNFREVYWSVFTHHYPLSAVLAVSTRTVMHEWITYYQWMWVNSFSVHFYIRGRNSHRSLSHNISYLTVQIPPKVIHKLKTYVPRLTRGLVSVLLSRSIWRWHSLTFLQNVSYCLKTENLTSRQKIYIMGKVIHIQ